MAELSKPMSFTRREIKYSKRDIYTHSCRLTNAITSVWYLKVTSKLSLDDWSDVRCVIILGLLSKT